MKLYNESGASCNATKEQSTLMLKSGWSRTAPEKDEPEKDEASESVAGKEESATKSKTKKIIPKRK